MSGYWQDVPAPTPIAQAPGGVLDLAFRMRCRQLAVDHAHALAEALSAALPWLADEPSAGVHSVHVAASGNGWQRPDDPRAMLQVSRRTRLVLRLPAARVEQAATLAGRHLEVGGQPVGVGDFVRRPLAAAATLFARHIAGDAGMDEQAFLAAAARELAGLGVEVRRLLPGRAHVLRLPGGALHTRSLMIAGLSPEQSLRVQARGLGDRRLLGCGLFIPHKSIEPVGQGRDT